MNKTILVVEDEVELLDVIGQVLRRAGYRVLTAHTSAEAVSMCECLDLPIDVILSDFNLPGENGGKLAIKVGTLRPDLPIVFMSGNAFACEDLTALGFTVLQKPFSFADMEYAVGMIAAESPTIRLPQPDKLVS